MQHIRSNPSSFLAFLAVKGTRLVSFVTLSSWMLAETLWFPYYLWTVKRLQQRHPAYHATSDFASRKSLVLKCLDSLDLAASTAAATTPGEAVDARVDIKTAYLKKVIEGWFLGAEFSTIRKENMKSWVAWAFLDQDLLLLDKDAASQVDALVKIIESRMNYLFPAGRNDAVKCIRLTLDPVQAAHRPLIYYGVCKTVNKLSHLLLRKFGFYQRTLDPMDVAGSGTLNYLYRPATEPVPANALPIVFIHGIGVGFAAYIPLIAHLPRNVPIYLIEWPHVSMQLAEEVPTIPDTLAFITGMLDRDHHAKASFVAHSLGTVAVSWILNSPLHKGRVGSVVLLDPVTFLLCDPAIAYNFLYRPPSTALELLMNYFVSREMYIANSLSRHFHWSKNVLFHEDLPVAKPGLRNIVVLSEEDAIVPSPRVKAYLEGSNDSAVGSAVPTEIDYHEGRNHGEMLFRPRLLLSTIEQIRQACGSLPSIPTPPPPTPASVTGKPTYLSQPLTLSLASPPPSALPATTKAPAVFPGQLRKSQLHNRRSAPPATSKEPAWTLTQTLSQTDAAGKSTARILLVPARGKNSARKSVVV